MSAEEIQSELLHKRWIHSHEEDNGNEMVFRPSTFSFPRSRGRAGFQLRPDKSLVEIGIGSTDVPVEKTGKWEIDPGGVLKLFKPGENKPDQILKITSVGPEKLIVQR
jgi:hypothetical protein